MGKRGEASVTHGHTIGHQWTRTYRSWVNMMTRCTNSNNVQYPDYGGRGITVCERWYSFTNFLADMGQCPESLTLERRRNNEGYNPDNCYWATAKQQANNRRSSRLLTHADITLTAAQWADRTGVPACNIYNRLNNLGWTVERTLTEGAK